MRSREEWLANEGLLNREAPDVRDLVGESKDVEVTFCSSFRCQGPKMNRRGRPIKIGKGAHSLRHCPNCGRDELFFDVVTEAQAALLRRKMKTR